MEDNENVVYAVMTSVDERGFRNVFELYITKEKAKSRCAEVNKGFLYKEEMYIVEPWKIHD